MSARWSNPSGSLGFDRFRVWPAGSDSYNFSELAANWDEADAIIGIPSSGNWPPSTGIDGGIYKEVKLLENNRVPIGACFPWFRPSVDVPLPAGCVVMDGSTVAESDHDFGIAGSVTLPDMRNAFVLGADISLTINQAAAAVGNANTENHLGAPGPQATGGENTHKLVAGEVPSHDHGSGGTHSHTGSTGPGSGVESAWWNLFGPGTGSSLKLVASTEGGGGASTGVTGASHTHPVSIATGGAHTHASFGGDGVHENRPRWVGLIWLCKVKNVTTL